MKEYERAAIHYGKTFDRDTTHGHAQSFLAGVEWAIGELRSVPRDLKFYSHIGTFSDVANFIDREEPNETA